MNNARLAFYALEAHVAAFPAPQGAIAS